MTVHDATLKQDRVISRDLNHALVHVILFEFCFVIIDADATSMITV